MSVWISACFAVQLYNVFVIIKGSRLIASPGLYQPSAMWCSSSVSFAGYMIFGGLGLSAERVKNVALLMSEELLINFNPQMTELSTYFFKDTIIR